MAVVTFDFDSTLTVPVWSEQDGFWKDTLHADEEVLGVLRKLADDGHEIHIVTTRYASVEPQEFVDAHDLPVEGIHFTGGKLKGEKLTELGSQLHFDDSTLEGDDCNRFNIPFILVVHPYDREYDEGIDRFDHFKTFMEIEL